MFLLREVAMLKIFVEEAAALASITLFVGMIAHMGANHSAALIFRRLCRASVAC